MAEVLLEEEVVEQPKNKFISSRRNDALKLVAMITMFIDHLGHMGIVGIIIDKLTAAGTIVVFDWYKLSRTIGRIAFPIFAYQVALGYSKTSNLKKYIQRLFIFAFISQIPYVLFSRDFVIHPFHFNVIFMLLVGVLVIALYDKMKALWKKDAVSKLLSVVLLVVMIGIIMFPQYAVGTINPKLEPASMEPVFSIGKIDFKIAYDFAFSYGTYGILMVLFFHIFKGKPIKMVIGYLLLSTLDVWLSTAGYLFAHGAGWAGIQDYTFVGSFLDFENIRFLIEYNDGYKTLDIFLFQERSLLTLPFILILERFHVPVKLNKFVGYWFYPLHMSLIFIAALIMVLTF